VCRPSPDKIVDDCNFSWTAEITENGEELKVYVNFDNVGAVSRGDERDYVLIKLWGGTELQTKEGMSTFEEPTFYHMPIPLQTKRSPGTEITNGSGKGL